LKKNRNPKAILRCRKYHAVPIIRPILPIIHEMELRKLIQHRAGGCPDKDIGKDPYPAGDES
jgi:hypothetical protein